MVRTRSNLFAAAVAILTLQLLESSHALSSIANNDVTRIGFPRAAPRFFPRRKIWHPNRNDDENIDESHIMNPSNHATPPLISPATGLKNQIYEWKYGQRIRYQVNGPVDGTPIILVHGLFVNSDHWRKTLLGLPKEEGNYRVYAFDMLGMGYSSKPPIDSDIAQAINGETDRRHHQGGNVLSSQGNNESDFVSKNIELTSGCGTKRRVCDVDLKHPLKSPYNFYTWSDVLTGFARDIVLQDQGHHSDERGATKQKIALVSNSKGTVTCLQAMMDDVNDELFSGVFGMSPNFRELHPAEMEYPTLTFPILKRIQSLLRNPSIGHRLYNQALKNPDTIKNILLGDPYQVKDAVDDALVQVLRDPLLHAPGAASVVMDTLSYSGGPLIEQQLSDMQISRRDEDHDENNRSRKRPPIWFLYGKDDPWTPSGRMEALNERQNVGRVIGLDGVGHCPHDEAPELVHPLLVDFLKQARSQDIALEEEDSS